MAAKKLLRNVGGFTTEIVGVVTSAGVANDGDFPVLDPSGRLDASMMPVGIAADTSSVLASEALAAGNLVNIYNNAGTANCRKADASTTGKQAHGFVLSAVASGANATVYLEGTNTQLSGMTAGNQFLSDTTPGGVTSNAPTGAGKIAQIVGVAVSATALSFEADTPIVLA